MPVAISNYELDGVPVTHAAVLRLEVLPYHNKIRLHIALFASQAALTAKKYFRVKIVDLYESEYPAFQTRIGNLITQIETVLADKAAQEPI